MTLPDPSFRYAWLIWACAFLLPWALLFIARPALRRPMLWSSVLTAPFGLTQPLFVPAYWNPPSLFDLAQRTGFDIESLIFCFAIGGLGVAGYRALLPVPLMRMDHGARLSPRHRWHLLALATPFFVFGALMTLPGNPIYPGIVAMAAGAAATLLCRPDLWRNTLFGGVVFFALYAAFLLGLKWLWPGYIAAVWNLDALLPWRPWGLPMEELLFGFAFGMYWSSVYEHLTWHQRDRNAERYRAAGKRFILHGGEKHEVTGHSFVAEANYASAAGRDCTRVVSCNTTSIVRTLGALKRAGLLKRARGTLLRRATDPPHDSLYEVGLWADMPWP